MVLRGMLVGSQHAGLLTELRRVHRQERIEIGQRTKPISRAEPITLDLGPGVLGDPTSADRLIEQQRGPGHGHGLEC